MPHRIYFAQHGLALDKTEDPERPLSNDGRQQTMAVSQTLRDANVAISNICHSGKLRARQTADIFADTIGINTTTAIDGLSPNDPVTYLAQNINHGQCLYIGHLPHLNKLLSYLVTGDENTNVLRFQNSAVACLEKNNGNYQVCWYLPPVFN